MTRFSPSAWMRPFAAAFVGVVLALAPAAHAIDLKFPQLDGHRVVDQANILSDATEQDLELKLKGLEDQTSDQVVVVTVDSLQGDEIEDYGYRLGRAWGIGQDGTETAPNGQKYKNNGLILLVAPNEHKVRIEVGYGLEPVMTDAMSSIIIRNDILPKFKAGDFDGGVEAGTDAIIQQISQDRGVAIQKAQAAAQEAEDDGGSHHRLPVPVIILIIIFFVLFSRGWLPWFLLGSIFGGGRGGGGGWSGGGGGGWSGGGGGGFSGGGGSFGGGGSSGSW
jgi:uncharacterized protein